MCDRFAYPRHVPWDLLTWITGKISWASLLPWYLTKQFLLIRSMSHYSDVIMGAMASQITSPSTVYSIVYSDEGQRKHRSSASLAFVCVIHRGLVNSPHKWPAENVSIWRLHHGRHILQWYLCSLSFLVVAYLWLLQLRYKCRALYQTKKRLDSHGHS